MTKNVPCESKRAAGRCGVTAGPFSPGAVSHVVVGAVGLLRAVLPSLRTQPPIGAALQPACLQGFGQQLNN